MLRVELKTSAKGNEFLALIYKKDNKDIILTFDTGVISRVTGLKLSELYRLDKPLILVK